MDAAAQQLWLVGREKTARHHVQQVAGMGTKIDIKMDPTVLAGGHDIALFAVNAGDQTGGLVLGNIGDGADGFLGQGQPLDIQAPR